MFYIAGSPERLDISIDTITKAISSIKNKYKSNSINILVSRDLLYTLHCIMQEMDYIGPKDSVNFDLLTPTSVYGIPLVWSPIMTGSCMSVNQLLEEIYLGESK